MKIKFFYLCFIIVCLRKKFKRFKKNFSSEKGNLKLQKHIL